MDFYKAHSVKESRRHNPNTIGEIIKVRVMRCQILKNKTEGKVKEMDTNEELTITTLKEYQCQSAAKGLHVHKEI